MVYPHKNPNTWVFGDNCWLKARFSYAEALEASKSLVDCKECTNCSNCTSCTYCIYCDGCSNCHNSNSSTNCVHSHDLLGDSNTAGINIYKGKPYYTDIVECLLTKLGGIHDNK